MPDTASRRGARLPPGAPASDCRGVWCLRSAWEMAPEGQPGASPYSAGYQRASTRPTGWHDRGGPQAPRWAPCPRMERMARCAERYGDRRAGQGQWRATAALPAGWQQCPHVGTARGVQAREGRRRVSGVSALEHGLRSSSGVGRADHPFLPPSLRRSLNVSESLNVQQCVEGRWWCL